MRRAIVFLAAALAGPLALTRGVCAAETLQELLEQTRQARAQEQQINAEREKEFTAARDRQVQLMREAVSKRDAAEARSQQLSSQYDANETRINELRALLKSREGNLGELFGVTRQVAGDVATVISQSIISAQYQDREEFLRKMAGAKDLPSITELERLWFEMQREMTETAMVARIALPVASADGTSTERTVLRVGPFIASTEGEFLGYLPGTKGYTVLSRQPPSSFGKSAEKLQQAQAGTTRSVVDPSRGVLLGMYVERPNVVERIHKGAAVGYVIIVVGVVGALLALVQLVYLIRVRARVSWQLKNLDRPTSTNPLGRVLLAFKGDQSRIEEATEVAELRISEAVLREVPKLERFQAFLRLAVAAGPLLGLVGTVIGMIITFQSITESGSSDPKLMATGIGQAMIATVLGLGIAIPLLFVNAGLASLSRSVVQILDEQSTGILAESIEKRRA
ncbi:MAG: MotA/TolQ/ExbB proton channel family protein [bacterium]